MTQRTPKPHPWLTYTVFWRIPSPKRAAVLLLIAGLLLAAGLPQRLYAQPDPTPGRTETVLDGTWQGAEAAYGTALDQATGWHDMPVPGITRITMRQPAAQVWVRRTLDIPSDWAGRRAFIRLGGALYHPHIYIDGQPIGDQLDGWHPLEVEITDHVTPGTSHELAVLTLDQSAVYDTSVPRGDVYNNQARVGKVLAPIGGYKDHVGIWDSVTLRSTPAVRIEEDELRIVPSTRQQTLSLSGAIDGADNVDGMTIRADVLDGDTVSLESDAVPVNANGQWSVSSKFENAHTWSPEDPHLYTLRLRLIDRNGEVIDELAERFGFKEFWTDGPDFYLNGVKRHLLAESEWPPSRPISRDKIRAKLKGFKDNHANAFRTHLGGWQRDWYEIADEIGIMMIPETGIYTDDNGMYAYDDERFWQNYRDHAENMLNTYRNHASTVMFSLGNEILFMGNAGRATDLPRKLGDMARFARKINPYHPYTFEADIDPDGAYDVIGLHYPHELPANSAYPNTADWLATRKQTEAGGGMLGQTRANFFWDRTKPLYIGEYLWVPYEDYSTGSVYFGEQAYQHRLKFWALAKYAAHHDQTLAYRRANVSGLCPWATFDDPQTYFKHVASFLYSQDRRAYPNERFDFTFDVFNDDPVPLTMTLETAEASGLVATTTQTLTLQPGGYQRVTQSIDTPASPGTLAFTTTLSAEGQALHTVEHGLEIWPETSLTVPDGVELVAYDPSKQWPGSTDTLDGLAKIKDPSHALLLIAPGALGGAGDDAHVVVGVKGFDTARFLDFVNAGGRAVVLEQTALAPLGLGVELIEHASTMTFAIDPSHPLLNGLDAQSLKHWRGDHYVSRHEIVRPDRAGGRGVVVSGGDRSLRQGPVADIPAGNGHVVLLQTLVGEKAGAEPAADRLLQNAVDYLASIPAHTQSKTVVLGGDDVLLSTLKELGVVCAVYDRPLTADDLTNVELVILHGGGEAITASREALAAHQKHGGAIYWHQPDTSALQYMGDALGTTGLQLTEIKSTAVIRERADPLLRGVSREDLTFTTDTSGWRRAIALSTNSETAIIPRVLQTFAAVPPLLHLTAEQLAVQDLPWVDNDNWNTQRGDALSFYSLGAVSFEVDAPEAGLYLLSLRAESSSNAGNGPQVQVHINDNFAALIQPRELGDYSAMIELPQGQSTVILVIDRGDNQGFGRLTLHELTIGQRLNYPDGVKVLTLPGSLVRIGDSLILDTNTVAAEGPNAVKSRRYLSVLLANLGAAFTPPAAGPTVISVPLDRFELQGESPYYEASTARLTLRSNARIEAPFTVANAGSYGIEIRGSSSPYNGVYCKVRILIDDKNVGELEINADQTADFGPINTPLSPGEHTLGIEFFNDGSGNGEDRNLLLDAVRFVAP